MKINEKVFPKSSQDLLKWWHDRENLCFWILILLYLIPIWLFDYFPSVDGPSHLEIAHVVKNYYNPEYSIFREYYILNKNLNPTWLLTLVLAGLMNLMPVLIAEKIFLSSYVILFPISIRYALQGIRPDVGFLSFLSFPLIYNFAIHLGLYSFSYSLVVFFFVVGYWLKYREQFTLRRKFILALLSLLLYFCHIVSLVMAYLAIGIFTAWLIILDFANLIQKNQATKRNLWNRFWKRTNIVVYGIFPSLVLLGLFVSDEGTEISQQSSGLELLKMLVNFQFLWSYDNLEILMGRILFIFFLFLFGYLLTQKLIHHQFNYFDGLIVAIIASTIIYFIAPESLSGGGNLNKRLSIYPFFYMIIWFGAQSYRIVIKQRIIIISVVIALILLGFHTAKYAQFNDYIKEYLSGTQLIEKNKTLLSISFFNRGYDNEGKLLSNQLSFGHVTGYIAVQQNIVTLTNYQATRTYFPIQYRSELNPRRFIMPKPQILSYNRQTKGSIDYILVWGASRKNQKEYYDKAPDDIFRQLAEGYKLIYTSPKRGLMQLYKRKELEQN